MPTATCSASIRRSTSSGSVRGVVRLSRQPPAATTGPPFSGRGTAGSNHTAPGGSLTSVVCGRKSSNRPPACACANTAFSTASTRGALRRVWSHARWAPSSAVTTKSRACAKTRGSARRKR
ncbi:hypothetical protein X551_04400 [Methylibium sp. T29]|nr:hypothetical protein X551_04400 [Methylibium sp. T29]EWS57478.1 hypothetical protein Y694_04526 [Methylibium sp. T29-B]